VELQRSLAALRRFFRRREGTQATLADLFKGFRQVLKNNNAAMEVIADMNGKLGGDFVFDRQYLVERIDTLQKLVRSSAYTINLITDNRYPNLYAVIEKLVGRLEADLAGKPSAHDGRRLYFLSDIEEELEDMVGNKAGNLAKIRSLPRITVAPGFVASVACFRDYLAFNDLFDTINEALSACRSGDRSVESTSRALRLSILGAEIPPNVRREVMSAAESLSRRESEHLLFSVRSSALGEDGELSFAGLHDSLLDVPQNELLSAYKKVLASLYNQSSLEYRLRTDAFSMEMAMPVLFQSMVACRVAGVLYTLDPNLPDREDAILSAAWGLGTSVVGGDAPADTFRASRKQPHAVLEQDIRAKVSMRASGAPGPPADVPEELQKAPCLTPEDVARIVETGLILERYLKQPLDVEWGLDHAGELWVLQARPMQVSTAEPLPRPDTSEIERSHRVVMRGSGAIAYRGIGAGPVWIPRDESNLSGFPTGAVLVARSAAPALTKAVPDASAIVTDLGTTTGHLATVAREFRVPTIVGTGSATQQLSPGQVVTVNAERNVIYDGRVEQLLHHQLLEKPTFEMTSEFRLLRRLLKKIAPLTLTDPEAPNFTPAGCRTLHDVMRLMHEKAFQALAQIGQNPRAYLRRGGKRLRSSLPLDLILIDLGGGIADEAKSQTNVDPGQITSIPMRAIWRGLTSPNAWSTEPVPVDFQGLMSSVTRTRSTDVLGDSLPGVNLAILGADYVNLSLPLGYHLTVIEAGAGPSPERNYIAFRFVGGVSDLNRRSRRAKMLEEILERAGFKVTVNGDLVVARAIDLTDEQLIDGLHLMGRLVGFTRQLDVLLKSDTDVALFTERFHNLADKRPDVQE
jgi:pyruvate,water dikinase